MTTESKSQGKNLLAQLLEGLVIEEGITPSPLKGVEFMRSNRPFPLHPIVYNPSIVIVGQGCKKGYLGGEVYTYDPGNYLVLSVPLPFECEVIASPEMPFLGVSVGVDPVSLRELLTEMDDEHGVIASVPSGIYSTPLNDELISATIRLLECLRSPMDSRMLGPLIVREITFRVLRGEQQGALRALVARHSRFSHIARVLRRIHLDYNQHLDIVALAEEANMSVSNFHLNFKSVTATSPLQYLKSIRLHKARSLMVQEGLNASTVAGRVGYESPSQFSREFKRFFGAPPSEEAAKLRTKTNEVDI